MFTLLRGQSPNGWGEAGSRQSGLAPPETCIQTPGNACSWGKQTWSIWQQQALALHQAAQLSILAPAVSAAQGEEGEEEQGQCGAAQGTWIHWQNLPLDYQPLLSTSS